MLFWWEMTSRYLTVRQTESPFSIYQCLEMLKYAKFDQKIWCGPRIMSIFTKIPLLDKKMLGKASSPFCILVTGQS